MWDARETGQLFVYLTASTLTDIFYVCRKKVGVDRAKNIIKLCLEGFVVLSVDRYTLQAALGLPGDDFEDNVQMVTAQSASLHLIVTRNLSDYRQLPLPALNPVQCIHRLNGLRLE